MTTLIYIDWIGLDMLMMKLLVFTVRTRQPDSHDPPCERGQSHQPAVLTPEEASQAEISPVNISVRRLKGRLGEERETSCEAAGRILDSAVQTGYILTVLQTVQLTVYPTD